ncbi:MAG: Na+/H+ antiporter subunit E [Wenzhouxiangellaceae bacterium]|nr:Na+/H+ antiporter subunit E [Wenzhouxiangellaceae bacterium]
MRYAISLTLVLGLLWLGISGVYKPLLFALGTASVLFVVWLSQRMDVVGIEHNPGLFSWRMPAYILWLLGQIIASNLQVARAVLAPGRHVRPRIFEAPVNLKSAVARVTYANSITLTPGTVTLDLDGDRVRVHALLRESAEGVQSGQMHDKVAWLEQSR